MIHPLLVLQRDSASPPLLIKNWLFWQRKTCKNRRKVQNNYLFEAHCQLSTISGSFISNRTLVGGINHTTVPFFSIWRLLFCCWSSCFSRCYLFCSGWTFLICQNFVFHCCVDSTTGLTKTKFAFIGFSCSGKTQSHANAKCQNSRFVLKYRAVWSLQVAFGYCLLV